MEASSHTVAGYRDTFRLLLRFASVRHGKPPIKLTVEDIDVDVVADFLVHGETARGNSARSRNTRLAAIRSFFRYVAMTDPAWLLHCQRILAMPNKRYVKHAVTFLDAEEIAALLAAPDRSTWAGRRDHALLLLAIQTGLRASELMNLRCGDVALGSGAHIRCMGKGRKERCTPLRRDTAKLLAAWIGNRSDNSRPLFPSIRGERLSRDALEHLVRKHCLTASRACPSLTAKRVTPHTLRHYLPFRTMSCNGDLPRIWITNFRSRRAKPPDIARHSLVPSTGSLGRGESVVGIETREYRYSLGGLPNGPICSGKGPSRARDRTTWLSIRHFTVDSFPLHGADGRSQYYVGAASRIVPKILGWRAGTRHSPEG
jgi:site-specific recombinase XerD